MNDQVQTSDAPATKRTNKASFDPLREGDKIVGCRITVKGDGGGVVDIRMNELSDEILGNLFVTGNSVKSKQYYNDEVAPAGVLSAVGEYRVQMVAGTWNSARETGGLLVRAFAEATGIDVEAAKLKLEGLTAKQRKLVETNAKVAPILARMLGATTQDDTTLLADLGL
jgi:hypothetical protein